MTAGFSGKLITASFAAQRLPSLPGAAPAPASAARALELLLDRIDAALGPASSVRAIADTAVIPLFRLLGYDVLGRGDSASEIRIEVGTEAQPLGSVIVVPWQAPLGGYWRTAVLAAIAAGQRWCFCSNGAVLRIVDAQHTWSRAFVEFDLGTSLRDPDGRRVLWTLARADAMRASPPLIEVAAEQSARHGVEVCRALGAGVLDAMDALFGALARATRRADPAALFDQALTVVYRVLFLLFAEARGLVPTWHPIYRRRYSLEDIVAQLVAGKPYRGLWEALQAISRLARGGCSAGDLRVTAFNGRLFSPAHTAHFDASRVDDAVMSRTIAALSTVSRGSARAPERIAYRELDVEQLGAVYEHVLDYEPARQPLGAGVRGGSGTHRAAPPAAPALVRTRGARKSSGTFYTPRALTGYLVARTLEPLVRNRSSEEILSTRVLDPAMGSGAFLVAACRFLASAVEDALVREGRWHPHDVTAADRAALRRDVASRCVFGVDLNPTAVQLARLSLWLATLAADRPLSFLDHHLVAGDSLVGASPDDVARQPGGAGGRRRRAGPLPLFPEHDVNTVIRSAVRTRLMLAAESDDSAAVVRNKERALASLLASETPLGRWSRVLDLWCATWFWDDGAPPERGAFQELTAHLFGRRCSLPERLAAALLERSQAIAAARRFLHWPLAFPEVFAGSDGAPLANPGFDAVVGNPPWDMVRADLGDPGVRRRQMIGVRQLTGFVRESGIYRLDSRAHLNRYQLFVERTLQLVRRGGRIGLVLPSGVVSDAGSASLRRRLFDRAAIDEISGFDNTEGIFPIHRGVRFVLLTGTAGAPTTDIRCRFGIRRLDSLDFTNRDGRQGWSDAGPRLQARTGPAAFVMLSRPLLARLSGDDDLGIPDVASALDLRLLERISASVPWLGARDGWHVRFRRELNATDDRHRFVPASGDAGARPVLEGKHVAPFRVAMDRCTMALAPGAGGARIPLRPRLAYRDVASATNRLTLIAAIVPARAVTTHTLFCLKTPLPLAAQRVLCALMNSFVANYVARMRVNTHVTAALVARLPVPRVVRTDPAFDRLSALAGELAAGRGPADSMPQYQEVQALAAQLYGLSRDEFAHVLSTFPLVPDAVRTGALERFSEAIAGARLRPPGE